MTPLSPAGEDENMVSPIEKIGYDLSIQQNAPPSENARLEEEHFAFNNAQRHYRPFIHSFYITTTMEKGYTYVESVPIAKFIFPTAKRRRARITLDQLLYTKHHSARIVESGGTKHHAHAYGARMCALRSRQHSKAPLFHAALRLHHAGTGGIDTRHLTLC